ncbi:hypothetical protein A2767_06510 [Candidatus Roizmanbacteria bacterium RIFCSPHIGHO2_01_FULL_35_10]|uniref:Uncharacterized protein n=1 Tax=Candidatus Roizmanbacteria bacterium RIFCSPLOWO2_01_FULL_35_13 TaxID=1802055 RepID=A0A1F7IGW7_9BACT|nr:MAG: hypothetical protein A2767_06510 [Candidatus Roizmanbacteria bacterium RIFCSPHIGHO2_01_FULL_35_10]OGK42614.1 MAG: hypothetical protein A3A74_06285 [Candidatus Roizmanbacteria bacterium RIFCSPLOWO2_01_FULL_35_13]
MMKNFLILIGLVFLILLININRPAYALNPLGLVDQVPGIGCGVPDDTKGANLCCTPISLNCSFGLLDYIEKVPGIGDWISNAKDRCHSIADFQIKYPGIKCMYGEEIHDRSGNCSCTLKNASVSPIPEIRELCKRYLGTSNPKEFEACDRCAVSGFWTGIGCIPLSLEGFINYIFTFGIGLGGIVAMLCIIYAAFMIQSSSGNPERIKKAQELLTSCVMGLMLIIFSVFILRVIGVDILKIPFLSSK